MKRLISFFLSAVLLTSSLCLTACNNEQPTPAVQLPTTPDGLTENTILDTDYDITPHILRDDTTFTITSPDQTTALVLSVKNGQLCYRVTRNDIEYIAESAMGVTVDNTAYGAIDTISAIGEADAVLRTDIRYINGRTAKADAPCVQARIPVGDMTLETRVYDNGAAFRYIIDGEGEAAVQSEQTAFSLPAGATLWAGATHPFYELPDISYNPALSPNTTLGLPATAELANGGYVSLLEADLSHYPAAQLEWQAPNQFGTAFLSGKYTLQDTVTSAWRIIGVADDLNELVNNTIIYQVNEDADKTLFEGDWVKPGRAAWSWITTRSSDRVTPAVIEEYTDLAATLGFEYNIIDEGWINWGGDNVLEDLAEQGKDYGVGQILWTGMTSGASYGGTIDNVDEAKAYLDYIASLGMSGAKVDFFADESNLTMGVDIYEEILRYAAQLGLVINFHGCNKPTGQDVTYPNELNREAIFGFENMNLYNSVAQAEAMVSQPFVRNLAGHADFTPAAESAFHMAQLVITDAPMQAVGSDLNKLLTLDSVEMLKSIPTVWQQTVVLPQSDIGNTAVFARQGNNASWYVGGINYMEAYESIDLDLSLFLGEGNYAYEIWTDDGGKLKSENGVVTADDTLTVPFSPLTGFVVRFDRLTLSQYGGAIDGPVTLITHNDATVVRYTLDGSEPTDSSPVWKSGESLTLTESCTVTLKITDGPDSGLVSDYRFNLLS